MTKDLKSVASATRNTTTRRRIPAAGGALTLAATLACTGAALSVQSAVADTDTVTVWEIDRTGAPPFKRTRVEVPVVDVAALETTTAATGETVKVWTVDRTGKPPFRRTLRELPVVDAAALETDPADAGDDTGTVFRGRPPFKRH